MIRDNLTVENKVHEMIFLGNDIGNYSLVRTNGDESVSCNTFCIVFGAQRMS